MAAVQTQTSVHPLTLRLGGSSSYPKDMYHFQGQSISSLFPSESFLPSQQTHNIALPVRPAKTNASHPGQPQSQSTYTTGEEDFLRRKTPHGTLTGAYDGTFAESDVLQHASKQFRVPNTAPSYDVRRPQIEAASWARGAPKQQNIAHQAVLRGGMNNWLHQYGSTQNAATHSQNGMQVDSSWGNYVPSFTDMDWQYNVTGFSGIMQPPYLPALGPTAPMNHPPYPSQKFRRDGFANSGPQFYGHHSYLDPNWNFLAHTEAAIMPQYGSSAATGLWPNGVEQQRQFTNLQKASHSNLLYNGTQLVNEHGHRNDGTTRFQQPSVSGWHNVQLPQGLQPSGGVNGGLIANSALNGTSNSHSYQDSSRSPQTPEQLLAWAQSICTWLWKNPAQPLNSQADKQTPLPGVSQHSSQPGPVRSNSASSRQSRFFPQHASERVANALENQRHGRSVRSNSKSMLWSGSNSLSLSQGSKSGPVFPVQPVNPREHRQPCEGADDQASLIDYNRANGYEALGTLSQLCQQRFPHWKDGLLTIGRLAFVLAEHKESVSWFTKVIELEPSHVEATSYLAAAYQALRYKSEAEHYWRRAVELQPTYFDAVEQLIALLCSDKRHHEALQVIERVENALHTNQQSEFPAMPRAKIPLAQRCYRSSNNLARTTEGHPDVGRLMSLLHAKGNILYTLQDQAAAAGAFEEVVMTAVGRPSSSIDTLITMIIDSLSFFSPQASLNSSTRLQEILLLPPEKACQTAQLCFPNDGELPGLKGANTPALKKSAVSVTSNSLLSLAKIFQDGMSSSNKTSSRLGSHHSIQDILALYYLSLSLQQSPSTANNVGILLANIQAPTCTKANSREYYLFPNVVPGGGIALALTYYQYGLKLDSKHAHLYTNLGSLLKDIGQLALAVNMYERAVACDGTFDIALANLANAVKDQGKVADAIIYYRRAVHVNPNFAEAVCGLANALNSICDWTGRGGVKVQNCRYDRWHVGESGELLDASTAARVHSGWIPRVVDIVESQLKDGQGWGKGCLTDSLYNEVATRLSLLLPSASRKVVEQAMVKWRGSAWEGAKIVRLVERLTKCTTWQWYQDKYVHQKARPSSTYSRPRLPDSLSVPGAPTVLPFHTFTLPMNARQVRLISQRNGLRVSCSTLRQTWLPAMVYPPPAPPAPCLRVGYVSSDFNNHPLAHLMQSVFGMHDRRRVQAYCYATTASDRSSHRQQIEREAHHFVDASSWSVEHLVQQIVQDGIHILVNLNGYTRGARNEVFAARPAPIQMSFMGFAGTLGAEWCDYLFADEIAIPRGSLRPHRGNASMMDLVKSEAQSGEGSTGSDDWIYGENIIYARSSFFCCDHRQSACADPASEIRLSWSDELVRRWRLRRELFPDIPNNAVIFANFNQLYKIDPTTFRTWLRILARVPNVYLWLLRFPADGATHLHRTATAWAGAEVASRIRFTDVAPKSVHILRACAADLFIDTAECNAHTTAADCLWSGTPLLTLPRYSWKMCSRMAAGILSGALNLDSPEGRRIQQELIATDEDDYEEKAVRLARSLEYGPMDTVTGFIASHGSTREQMMQANGRLASMRYHLWTNRWQSKLFDTRRWVRDLELAYEEAWRRWVNAESGDIWLDEVAPRHAK